MTRQEGDKGCWGRGARWIKGAASPAPLPPAPLVSPSAHLLLSLAQFPSATNTSEAAETQTGGFPELVTSGADPAQHRARLQGPAATVQTQARVFREAKTLQGLHIPPSRIGTITQIQVASAGSASGARCSNRRCFVLSTNNLTPEKF